MAFTKPVVRGVSYFLGHVPGLIRHGSKPSREIPKDPELLNHFIDHLRTFDDAVSYPPNQVFIGNMDPEDLTRVPDPWFNTLSQMPHAGGPSERSCRKMNLSA